MKKIFSDTIIKKLAQAFAKKTAVLAVYVFGSQINQTATAKSDLDLAVAVDDRQKTSERKIIKFLQKQDINIPFSLDVSCVDLSSPPLFLFQIIKNGLCVYERNPLERVDFEAKTLNIYYDNQHLRNIYRRYLQKSLQEGTYGY